MNDLVVNWRINGNILLLEVLMIQLLQWNSASCSISIISFEGSIGNKRRNILLELSQIRNNVVLSEDNAVLVVHLVGDT